jgi:O-glycosyl hydrolase
MCCWNNKNWVLLCLLPVVSLLLMGAQGNAHADGAVIVTSEALLTTPVGGLENTRSTSRTTSVTGQPFSSSLQVTVGAGAPETNATQLTLRTTGPVKKGDVLLASFSLRGASADGKSPAQVMFLFERTVSPWTKSISQGAASAKRPDAWKRILLPFAAAEDYAPGEAMASLRFAFGPQTVEVGGLSVVDFGTTKSLAMLQAVATEQNPLGSLQAAVHWADLRQTLVGFGGNFCQPRYGSTEPMDLVGRYNLEHLAAAHARIGIPLNSWTPEKGVYRDEAQAHAAFLQMHEMKRRKIPFVGSVWEGPLWMLGGRAEQMGRKLSPERVGDCIESLAQFLVTARDKYDAEPEYISFNEPDYGVNFLFTPADMAAFIRQAGPRFREVGIKTKFLVGDTTGGMPIVQYARPLLEDRELTPYLGPIAFHCWDVLGSADARYAEIAALGKEFDKPVWCTEAGHDSALWQAPNPWGSWDNAIRTALAYEKTLRLSGAVLLDYWTYQDNYPIVDPKLGTPYPVFRVIQQMAEALPAGSRIAAAESDSDDLRILASVGPRSGQFGILLINPIGAGKVTLSHLSPNANLTEVCCGEDGHEVRSKAIVDNVGRVRVSLPARSVVTVLGVGVPGRTPAY